MKKSTHTPDPAMPDLTSKHGSGREVVIPTTPVRIFAFDKKSFLHLHGGNDPVVRITSDINNQLFAFWKLNPAGRDGYTINCFPFDLCLAIGNLGELIATTADTGFDKYWTIEDARPGGFVFIRRSATHHPTVFTLSSFDEDSPVFLADGTGPGNEKQLFSLGRLDW